MPLNPVRKFRGWIDRLAAWLSAGDYLLDDSGNIKLDASGNFMLDDGAGNDCDCGCGGPFDCNGNANGRCCYSSACTAVISWTVDGGTSDFATGSFTIPWEGTGGDYNWHLLDNGQTYFGDPVEILVKYDDGTTSGNRPSWKISLISGDFLVLEFFVFTAAVGTHTDYVINYDPACCGVTGATATTSHDSAEDADKPVTFTITINNNKCCSIMSAPIATADATSCVKLASVLDCDTDTPCNYRCVGCCATYRVVVNNGSPATYDLAQLTEPADSGVICQWRVDLGGGDFIAIVGKQLQIRLGSNISRYDISGTWTGCPPDSGWSFTAGSGTPPTLVSVTKLDCP